MNARKLAKQTQQSSVAEIKHHFKIVKLEERIAPAKGGVPGQPPYHSPPGQCSDYGWGGCCKGGGPNRICDG